VLGILLRLAAVSACVYLAVDIGYRTLEARLWMPETPAIEERGKALARGRPSSAEFGVILERNLFGSASPSAKIQPPEVKKERDESEPQPATIKARLLGTVSGPDGLARAVMEDPDKKRQALYRVGDKIQGALIKEISRGRVIVRVRDRDEVLVTAASASAGKAEAKPASQRRVSSTDVVVKKEDVESSFANLNELLNQMRIRPYFADGKPAGLAVAWVKPDSFFSAMGLRSGDVIQGINDSPIKSADDIMAVYKDLKVGSDISLQVLRDSKVHTINYRFE
jgi:general secretion pathway protein C